MKKNRFSKREFLNLPGEHSGGHIVAYINTEDNEDWSSTDIHLSIADCMRSVDFDFDLSDKQGRKNSMHKVDAFINTLTEFREALLIAAKREKGIEKRREEKRRKEKENRD